MGLVEDTKHGDLALVPHSLEVVPQMGDFGMRYSYVGLVGVIWRGSCCGY